MKQVYNSKFYLVIAICTLLLGSCPLIYSPLAIAQEEADTFDEFEEFDQELESSESTPEGSSPSEGTLSEESLDDDSFFEEPAPIEDSEEATSIQNEVNPNAGETNVSEPEVPIENLEDDEFFGSDEGNGDSENLNEDDTTTEIATPNEVESTESTLEANSKDLKFDDEPDLGLELKLHDIYMKYLAEPIPDKEWDVIVGTKTSEVYTIQKGDNLWDLSKTFFGDGNYWPKIWSVNSKITNPHLIEPKNVIRFILGNENDAPQFAVTENSSASSTAIAEEEDLETTVEDANLEDLTQDAVELEAELITDFNESSLEEELLSDEELEGVVIPPPEVIVRPVTQIFPPSLPQWRSHADAILKSREIDLKKVNKSEKKISLPLSYYLDENQPAGVAKIVDIEGGGKSAAQFQYIYIRAKKGYLKPGEKLMAVKNNGPLITNEKVQEDAIIWEVQGQIIVDQKVEATKKYKSDLYDVYRAYIESALTAVMVGADVLRGGYVYVDDNKKGRVPNVSGLIIGGAIGNKRNLLSKDSLAYLNVGINEGVKVGDVLPVYSNNYTERNDPYVLTTHRPMGLIKIAKVSELYSTGYIVENDGSINIGDFVGSKKGFEKELTRNRVSTNTDSEKNESVDQDLLEIQSLLNSIEEDLDPAQTDKFEYME